MFAVAGQSFFFCFLQNKQIILSQDNMYMKRAGDNTGLESTKVVCSIPIISKMFCSMDRTQGWICFNWSDCLGFLLILGIW